MLRFFSWWSIRARNGYREIKTCQLPNDLISEVVVHRILWWDARTWKPYSVRFRRVTVSGHPFLVLKALDWWWEAKFLDHESLSRDISESLPRIVSKWHCRLFEPLWIMIHPKQQPELSISREKLVVYQLPDRAIHSEGDTAVFKTESPLLQSIMLCT
jgi:hypothetical protein